MKNTENKTTTNEVGRNIVKFLLYAAKHNEPAYWTAYFTGAIIGNVIGNLPDEYWQKARKAEPCDREGCDCHVLKQKLFDVLDEIRKDHHRATQSSVGN